MNFLKSLFKREPGPENVAIDDLQEWFSKKNEKTYSEIKDELREKLEDLEKEKDALENNLIALRKAKLSNPNISTREIQIMEGNRDLYIKKAMDLLNNIEFKGEMDYDALSGYCGGFEAGFAEFSKGTARAFYILNQFFGNEMNKIAQNLANIEELQRKMRQISEDPDGLRLMKEVQDGISELVRLKILKSRISDQLNEESSKLLNQKAYLKKLEKQKDELENSDEYAQLDGLRTARMRILKEMESNASSVEEHFSQLDKAFRKYQHMSDDNASKIIDDYVQNPLEALSRDSSLRILETLSLMKDRLDSIETDDRKKLRIKEHIDRLDKDFLLERIERNKELLSRLSDVDARIKQDKIMREIEDVNYKMDHAKKQVKRIEEEELKRLNAQLSKIDPEKLKGRISEQMERLTGIKLTIT